VEFPSNLSAIYTKWGTQSFPPFFAHYAIFDRNFSKIVAPSSDEIKNCSGSSERAMTSEKKMETG